MEKFCVFCGKKPQAKTKEHVIPDWLIKYTGKPDRLAYFGISLTEKSERKYSFDQFTFPACDNCNRKFSRLEEACKPTIIDMLNEKPLSEQSLSQFLTWLDKIRVGLWLGMLYLNENKFGIKPHFHIQDRLDTSDRMLLIYKSDTSDNRICIIGTSLPFFEHYPSCFGLILNQFYFINLSDDFLFSRRLGLPYASNPHIFPGNGEFIIRGKPERGRNYAMLPLLRTLYNLNCVEIYQPIVNPNFLVNSEFKSFYQNDYTKKYIDINVSHVGKVLIKRNDDIVPYSSARNLDWIPEHTFNKKEMLGVINTTLSLQNHLIDENIKFLPKESVPKWKLMKQINSVVIKRTLS